MIFCVYKKLSLEDGGMRTCMHNRIITKVRTLKLEAIMTPAGVVDGAIVSTTAVATALPPTAPTSGWWRGPAEILRCREGLLTCMASWQGGRAGRARHVLPALERRLEQLLHAALLGRRGLAISRVWDACCRCGWRQLWLMRRGRDGVQGLQALLLLPMGCWQHRAAPALTRLTLRRRRLRMHGDRGVEGQGMFHAFRPPRVVHLRWCWLGNASAGNASAKDQCKSRLLQTSTWDLPLLTYLYWR